jgi:hypothetical protein
VGWNILEGRWKSRDYCFERQLCYNEQQFLPATG